MTDGVQALPSIDVEVTTYGHLPAAERHARTKIGNLARLTHLPEYDAGSGDPSPRIVRHASFSMTPCSVDVAIGEMELLGYDFHLIREIASGAAGVVYRGGPTAYRLALVAPDLAAKVAPFERPVTISPHPLPCLTEESALERLTELGLPFLFFIEASQGRACVLYRRRDGRYGLISPPA